MDKTHGVICFIVLVALLASAAATDLRTGKIHNRLTYPAMLLGLLLGAALGLWQGGWTGAGHGLGEHFLALLAGLIPAALIFLVIGGGLNAGDVKLIAAVGSIAGSWQVVLGTAFYGLIVALVYALVLMVRHQIILHTLRNILLAMMGLAAGQKPDMQAAQSSPSIPQGLTLAVGGVLAGVEHLLRVPLPWSKWIS